MNFLSFFGIGAEKIRRKECHVTGYVTKVYPCWWASVKYQQMQFPLKPKVVRYCHIITFSYTVNGIPYGGKLWVGIPYRPPVTGTSFEVYYNPENPKRYACPPFPFLQ